MASPGGQFLILVTGRHVTGLTPATESGSRKRFVVDRGAIGPSRIAVNGRKMTESRTGPFRCRRSNLSRAISQFHPDSPRGSLFSGNLRDALS